MALLTLRNITLAYGGPPLFDGINLQVEAGDRLCLLGRNGCGKSTLLRLINGEETAQSGEITSNQGLRTALVTQTIPDKMQGRLLDLLLDALPTTTDETWQHEQEAQRILNRLHLDGEADFAALSGGTKRRVLLAQALLCKPDILLLDEPTNHLDIETIIWLEDFLAKQITTCLFVTHDRAFARRLANKVAELDRGRLYSFDCSYDQFLQRREELLAAEITRQAQFDRKLAAEEAWIRQGIKARRTRNEGRVRALKALREEHRLYRQRQGTAKMRMQEAQRSGKLVLEADDVSFAYAGKPVISSFSAAIQRGDKVGIVGPNGCGKTTLLKLLLGELAPQKGSIRQGTKLEILYMDQLRDQLELDKTVAENLGEGSDTLLVNGISRHVIGYLQDFLFTPDRARSPVSILSGGERNRLLLAKLFARPANFLVLDEPTNDLDAETLELLEDLLADFKGTLLLVSHDREFLDNVVTSTLFIRPDGTVLETVGGYSDLQQELLSVKEQPIEKVVKQKQQKPKERPRKLSFKEERELEELPDRIMLLEDELQQLHNTLADPDFYRTAGDEVAIVNNRMAAVEYELQAMYSRWEELESV